MPPTLKQNFPREHTGSSDVVAYVPLGPGRSFVRVAGGGKTIMGENGTLIVCGF